MAERAENAYRTPFFMLFPWGKAAGLLAGLYLVSMFVYRVSQVRSEATGSACFAAMVVGITAGALSLYPVGKLWGGDQWRALLGVFLGILIRLLIGGAGVGIIILFTDINKILFILFLKFYYALFLIVDTWLAVWIVRHSDRPKTGKPSHGTLWDIVGQL